MGLPKTTPAVPADELLARFLSGEPAASLRAAAKCCDEVILRTLRPLTTKAQRTQVGRLRRHGPGSPVRKMMEEAGPMVKRLLAAGTVEEEAARYGVTLTTVQREYSARATPAQRKEAQVRKSAAYRKAHPLPWAPPVNGFKPGTIRGHAARAWVPVGTVRVIHGKKATYRAVKVLESGPPAKKWVRLARRVWEEAHGPIPPRHKVMPVDGNPLHDWLGNLECVSFADALKRQKLNRPKAFGAKRQAHVAAAMRRRSELYWSVKAADSAKRAAEFPAPAPAPVPLTPREKARANIERLLREEAA